MSNQDDRQQLDEENARLRARVAELERQLPVEGRPILCNRATGQCEMLDGLRDVVYTLDPNGRFTYINAAVTDILGFSVAEILGRNFSAFIHPDTLHIAQDTFRRSMQGERVRGEITVVDKAGQHHFAEYRASGIVRDGEIVGTRGVVRDISARRASELEAARVQRLLQGVFDGIEETVFVVDNQGCVVAANKTTAKRLGCTVEQMIGQNILRFVPGEVGQRRWAAGEQVVATKEPVQLTDERAGRRFDITLYPILDTNEEVGHIVVFARDITERVQAERALHENRAHMARAERLASAGTLSAMVAHELTQPLTVIRLSAQNALAALTEKQGHEQVHVLIQEGLEGAEHAAAIVERFRDFARATTEPRIKKVNLAILVGRLIQLMEVTGQQAQVSFVLEDLTSLVEIEASERDLEQLLFILVENSIQAADPTQPSMIRIQGRQTDAVVTLQVTDTCGGMDPMIVDKVFDPFFTTKPRHQGTGLGLCIAERIVREMGGDIRLENDPGQGVTFILTLPVSITA